MIELSQDQKLCFDSIMDWYKRPDDLLTMGGFAGTGKTTLISKIRNELSKTIRIAFISYTGKAASVLRSKLKLIGIERFPEDYCGTIHGLIYEPLIDDETNEIVGWHLKPMLDYDIIIIDEASMVSEDILRDLKSFDIPLLAIGDHGQLPPIEGSLNLMANPHIKLEKVHRFAENNALTKVSILAREEGYIPHGQWGENVIKVPPKHSLITEFIDNSGDFDSTAILCGFNKTRVQVNKKIRTKRDMKGNLPDIGERVICLKNNRLAQKCPIYNGVLGTVKGIDLRVDHAFLRVSVDGEYEPYRGRISRHIFNNEKPNLNEFIYITLEEAQKIPARFSNPFGYTSKKKRKKQFLDCFDFGYCLTVHKSQGSEWERVMVIEQPCSYWSGENWNRWLYTAVTRSTNELLIVR